MVTVKTSYAEHISEVNVNFNVLDLYEFHKYKTSCEKNPNFEKIRNSNKAYAFCKKICDEIEKVNSDFFKIESMLSL